MNRKSRAIVKPAPAPAPTPFGQVFKEGLVWGAGNAIAGQAIRSLFGFSTSIPPIPTKSPKYTQCMLEFNDEAACKHLAENKGE
jgi:hypothetical protein